MSTTEPAPGEEGLPLAPPRSIGVVLLAVGLVSNEWVLARLFAADGFVSGKLKLAAIVFFQAFCLLAGLGILLPRLRSRIQRRGWVPALGVLCLASLGVTLSSWGVRGYRAAHSHTTHSGHEMENATPEQRRWADEFYKRSLEAAKRNGWFDFEKARADGFVKMWKDKGHYQQEEFIFDDEILNPDRPEFLMYLDSPRGKLLVGFMYLTRQLDEVGPRPGGSLARWHFHSWAPRGMCAVKGILPVGRPNESGRCAEGTLVMKSAEMLHVYFVPHPLGRFADAMVFPQEESAFDVTLLHPALVHFTVALFLVAVMLDAVGRAFRRPQLHATAWINLALAGLFGALTVISGLAAEVNLLIGPHVHVTLTTHKRLGFGVLACLAALILWRLKLNGAFPSKFGRLYLGLGALGALLTLSAGYFGAELVYVEGVAVQAVDRLAIDGYRERVWGEYLGEPVVEPTHHHGE